MHYRPQIYVQQCIHKCIYKQSSGSEELSDLDSSGGGVILSQPINLG